MEENLPLHEPLAEATPSSSKSRLDCVDIAKGILILAVVLSHAWFANADLLGNYFPYSMPAFFFLSGYVYKPGRTYWQNMGRRVIQLLLPYLFFSIFCCLLYPIYNKLAAASNPYMMAKLDLDAWKAVWVACVKGDALNMLMSTPMWFLTSLFTGSIFFFALVNAVRDSAWKTWITALVLVALTVAVVWIKKDHFWPWHIGYALFGCAMMLLGAHLGQKKLFASFSAKTLIAGLILLLVSAILNRFFPGSGKTSIEQYIEGDMLYGVITCFAIALAGSIGLLCICTLLAKIPGIRHFFGWLGRNTIWILCIHYSAIMLIELWLFNHKVLSNSLIQVITVELYGYGIVKDKPSDIVIKILVALLSIGLSAIYVAIHKAVKNAIKKKKEA